MPNIADELQDLAITRSILLQRIANGLSKEVATQYQQIIDDITKQIKSGDEITIQNMNKIISELKTQIADNAKVDLTPQLTDIATAEASWAMTSVNGAVGIDIMSKLPTERVISKIAKTSLIEGATISDWYSSLNQSAQFDVSKAVKLGVTMGESNRDISKRVQDTLIVSKNHADSISRTAVATVSNQARMATYEENEDIVKGYEHSATLDNRTSSVCATRDGAFWDKEGKGLNDKGKKFTYRHPPLHFRCRSVLLPILKTFREIGIDLDEIPSGTRASSDGQVSSGTTFEKWFESKDKTFKEKYLGKGRYELYKSGKITFSDLVGQNGKTLSISELMKIDGRIVAKAVKVPTIDFGYGGKFNGYVADIRDEAKIVIDKFKKPFSIGNGNGAYNADFGQLTFPNNANTIFLHEYGHHIDYTHSKVITGELFTQFSSSSLTNGFNLTKAYSLEVDYIGIKDKTKLFAYIDSISEVEDKYSRAGMMDILDSLTVGKVQKINGLGHGAKYYKNEVKRHSENFANLFSLWSDNKHWEKTKQLFPNLTDEFEKIMKEVIDGKFD